MTSTRTLSRRDFARLSMAGVLGGSCSGWLPALAARTAETNAKPKQCILLWMEGAPSQKDTFDLKPGTEDAGEFKPIDTSVPGIQICDQLPTLAKHVDQLAILRGMSTGEASHERARYYLHTGYALGSGGLVYPSLGSLASAEIGDPKHPLPNYVAVGIGTSFGAGYLGSHHQPLVIKESNRGVENLKSAVESERFAERLNLLDELERTFQRTYRSEPGTAHQTTYRRAIELMQSKEAKAFDISKENATTRKAYGEGRFADSMVLARRLIESGVSFVEVIFNGWDTHQNNYPLLKNLLLPQLDRAMSALLVDLKERGLLESTLVVWMGEFGRHPKITNPKSPGRDHYAKAWTTILAGAGIRGGQVVGKTDKEGAEVVERPISTVDFLSTVCKALGIDYNKKNTVNGRPIRVVDKGATPIEEVLP